MSRPDAWNADERGRPGNAVYASAEAAAAAVASAGIPVDVRFSVGGLVISAGSANFAVLISVFALIISAGSAMVAALTYRRTQVWRRESQLAGVVAFRLAIRRKQVLAATDTSSTWSLGGIHDSVRELRDELLGRVLELPPEALGVAETTVEGCTRLLNDLRPWATDHEQSGSSIHDVPEARAAVEKWVATIETQLAALDGFDVARAP